MAKKEIIDEPVANEAADRNSRNKDTREASTRPVQWRPANKLYAPGCSRRIYSTVGFERKH